MHIFYNLFEKIWYFWMNIPWWGDAIAFAVTLFALVILFFHCLIFISLPITFALTIVLTLISFIKKVFAFFNKSIDFLDKVQQKLYKLRIKIEYAFILEDVVDDD